MILKALVEFALTKSIPRFEEAEQPADCDLPLFPPIDTNSSSPHSYHKDSPSVSRSNPFSRFSAVVVPACSLDYVSTLIFLPLFSLFYLKTFSICF